jgi:hypothetical protein
MILQGIVGENQLTGKNGWPPHGDHPFEEQ